MTLSQKEQGLLKDLQTQEKLCIDKYNRHSGCASDPQLKDMFSKIAQTEQQHLNCLNSIMSGTVPQGGGSSPSPSFKAFHSFAETPEKKSDCYLCTDVLTTEKHASQLYDTCIFEFSDENARRVLNQIQKDEQNHGKMIYDYMQANSMYS